MGGAESHFGFANALSANKNGKQMISICTQDYQITEMQSPLQQNRG